MIFLRRLCLRAAASKKVSGQITVWMALCFLVFLGLYLACLQSVWKQYQRKQAEQAVEAGMFSLFSEFESHLLEKYDLFCLDTSFGSGAEQTDELCSHLWHFTESNITDASGGSLYGLNLQGVNVKDMVLLTDGSGAAFFRQAVEIMKEKTGASLAEDWLLQDLFQNDSEENIRRFQEDCEENEGTISDYEDEEDDNSHEETEEEEEDPEEESGDGRLDPEAYQWDGLWNGFTLSKAVPGDLPVSERTAATGSVPSHRELSVGVGKAAGTENQILQKQWLVSYLCEYMTHAQEMLPKQRAEGWLDYQLEYIVSGKASDRENLESAVQKLLLMREGMNYAFLLAHPELKEEAAALSLVLAGMTGNAVVIKGLEHLILLGWAYGESLVEVRQLLKGCELTAVKRITDWQVPLTELLMVLEDPGRYDTQLPKQKGISYEVCLRIFLMMESAETLSMRALDVIEGETGFLPGCGNLRLDHCADYLTAQVWMEEVYLERSYGYE